MTNLNVSTKPLSYDSLIEKLGHQPLFTPAQTRHQQQADQTGWLLSPEPYEIGEDQHALILKLGTQLHQFAKATQALYRLSLKDPTLDWVKTLYEANKPEALIKFSQMNRFKSQFPVVIRPDLLVTAEGFALCEIDSVPGGIGFTASLEQAYRLNGCQLLGAEEGLVKTLVDVLIASVPDTPNPTIAVMVSQEAGDYKAEWQWFVTHAQPFYPNIYLVDPEQVELRDETLGFLTEQNEFKPIDLLYRFYELFDLENIPGHEQIQLAIKKGWVICTPAYKPYLEEKFSLAMLHHPYLESFWQSQLGEETLHQLKQLVPQSWILNPESIPHHAAVTPTLNFNGTDFRTFQDLTHLTQKQRRLVIKPSGFSPLAWGSKGVTVGHDIPQTKWESTLQDALKAYDTTPHLLQRYESPKSEPYRFYHPASKELVEAEGRTRLCPYYVVNQDKVSLAGMLATTCPKNKKVIHGMSEGVMRPVRLRLS